MPVWIDNDTLYTKALSIAMHAHHGQYRKYSKQPYIHHPIRVSETVRELFQHRDEHQHMIATALLHDVLEDTWMEEHDLADVPKEVKQYVKALSEDKELSYSIRRKAYIDTLRESPEPVKLIKLSDMWDNIRDWPERGKSYQKYLRKCEKTLRALRVDDPKGKQLKQRIEQEIQQNKK